MGANMDEKQYRVETSHKSKTATLLLCIFTGMFGGHMFYVGRIGMGVLYLFTGGFLMLLSKRCACAINERACRNFDDVDNPSDSE